MSNLYDEKQDRERESAPTDSQITANLEDFRENPSQTPRPTKFSARLTGCVLRSGHDVCLRAFYVAIGRGVLGRFSPPCRGGYFLFSRSTPASRPSRKGRFRGSSTQMIIRTKGQRVFECWGFRVILNWVDDVPLITVRRLVNYEYSSSAAQKPATRPSTAQGPKGPVLRNSVSRWDSFGRLRPRRRNVPHAHR